MYLEVYDRDKEDLPDELRNCIVYWEKGYLGQPFWKGEVYDELGNLAGTDTAFSRERLIEELKTYIFTCQGCHKVLSWEVESDEMSSICEDCYAETEIK